MIHHRHLMQKHGGLSNVIKAHFPYIHMLRELTGRNVLWLITKDPVDSSHKDEQNAQGRSPALVPF